jgi:outer membrane protein assembly factor BamB
VFSVPVGANPQYFLDHGSLYVFTQGTASAYQVTDGRLRWRTAVGDALEWVTLDSASGTLMAMFDSRGSGTTAVALDLATGIELWRRAGISGQFTTGSDTLVLYGTNADPTGAQPILAVHRRTGELLWQRELPDRTTELLVDEAPGAAPTLITLHAGSDPEVEQIDLGTGRTLARSRLAGQFPTADVAHVRQQVGFAGHLLLYAAATDTGARVYAFDTRTLTLTWTASLPRFSKFAGDCAGLICLFGDGGTTLLDPATGTVLATAPWRYVIPLPHGRYLAESDAITLVDEQLRVRLPLGPWQIVTLTEPVLVARPGSAPDMSWIGELDLDSARILPIGKLRGIASDSCSSEGGYLACRSRNQIEVYRL